MTKPGTPPALRGFVYPAVLLSQMSG
ncbi:uncharacterized protein METZ01_LOCUS162716, partial [marine metagenome]